ncbi:MAG: hypothetical protein QNJ65_11355 [Xenococcaceae cyanobacterium MO_234.B1]|nr:hypothetical protein [Xenococcaceae cyanobacterium MO_234.B1]
MFTLLLSLFLIGWVAAAVIGTQAYFKGEQSKPIHERNLKSESFETIAQLVTGQETDHSKRVLAYGLDSYGSNNLPNG